MDKKVKNKKVDIEPKYSVWYFTINKVYLVKVHAVDSIVGRHMLNLIFGDATINHIIDGGEIVQYENTIIKNLIPTLTNFASNVDKI